MNRSAVSAYWDHFRTINGITMRAMAEGTAKGDIEWSEEKDAAATAKLKSQDDLIRFASDSWKASNQAIQGLSDAQIAGMVKTPWGQSFPGFVCVNIIYDEHLHHRGQLYAYLRQLGAAPPMVWDFEHNAPEFQQKQAQQA